MKWYTIIINYLWNETDNAALECSFPAGEDKGKAIEQYKIAIAEHLICRDDRTKPAKIELIEYVYSQDTNNTCHNIICQNR